MKKSFGYIALLLACLLLCTACGETPVTLTANWHGNTGTTTGISNTYEKLVYSVTYDATDVKTETKGYSLEYRNGVYTTVLQNDTYTRENGSVELVYKLTSTFTIDGKITCGEESLDFSDSSESEVYFRTVDKQLFPVYSHKKMHTTTPKAMAATELKNVYAVYDYETFATYSADGTSVDLVYKAKEKPEDETYKIEETKTLAVPSDGYSFFDNEQLLFMMRGMTFTGTANRVHILNASARTVQTLILSNTSQKVEMTFNALKIGEGEAQQYKIATNTVTVQLDATMRGPNQTFAYACPVDGAVNTYRNVLLHAEVPLSYSLGKFVYSLTEAQFTK